MSAVLDDKDQGAPGGQVLNMTHPQCVNRLQEIRDAMGQIADLDNPTSEDDRYFTELEREFNQVDSYRKKLERDASLARIRSAAAGASSSTSRYLRTERGAPSDDGYDDGAVLEPDSVEAKRFRNPWDLSEVRTFARSPGEVGQELRARAFSAIEHMPYASSKVREATTQLIETWDGKDSKLSQLCLATSSPDYMRAFVKLVRSQGSPAVLDAKESAAYTRAMSLTDAAGGFLVPFQLDPTVILTAAGSRNRIRQIARVVQAAGDVWNGISSAGVTGSWDTEASEVSDDAPTFASPAIPIYKGAVFVPISIEAAQDEQNVAQEVARMIAFEKDRMESVAFVTGTGTNEPTGIVTALTGTASEIVAATADTFAVADIYALDSALPARFADNATWLAHRAIYNLVRRFDTQGGANLWETLGNGLPPQLLGRPAVAAEAMDSTVTALAANYLAVFGDFENYVIADRVGTTIEYIPHLFGANRRPTGQRGWYAWFRVGADSVNDAAFRMLNA